jgi:hypothetical protein
MKMQYVGGLAAVELVHPGTGRRLTAQRGVAVDVPAEMVDELAERDDWQTVAAAKTRPAQPAPEKE